jgi:hypothetical protein
MIFICISLYFHQNFIYNSWFLASSRLCVCVCVCVCVCSNYVASIIEQFPLEWEISPHKIMLSIDTNYNEIDIYFDFPWSYILYYSNQLVFINKHNLTFLLFPLPQTRKTRHIWAYLLHFPSQKLMQVLILGIIDPIHSIYIVAPNLVLACVIIIELCRYIWIARQQIIFDNIMCTYIKMWTKLIDQDLATPITFL